MNSSGNKTYTQQNPDFFSGLGTTRSPTVMDQKGTENIDSGISEGCNMFQMSGRKIINFLLFTTTA